MGGVRVTTDATGRVVAARMQPGIHPRLDALCVAHAKKEWRGRANVTRVVPVSFVLDTRKPPRSLR